MGKILVWNELIFCEITKKKSKKSEPFEEFLERYLFGAILANYRLPERKIEKSLKKRHH